MSDVNIAGKGRGKKRLWTATCRGCLASRVFRLGPSARRYAAEHECGVSS